MKKLRARAYCSLWRGRGPGRCAQCFAFCSGTIVCIAASQIPVQGGRTGQSAASGKSLRSTQTFDRISLQAVGVVDASLIEICLLTSEELQVDVEGPSNHPGIKN
jgi:hypothetical protein